MAKIGRNSPCPCGSGKKFKKCYVRKDEIGLLDPGPVPQSAIDATDRMMEEEGYTHEKALQLQKLVKLRRAYGQLMFGGGLV